MSDGMTAGLQVTGTAVVRRASSACCGTKLAPGTEPGTYQCRSCGQPCDRVLSQPQEGVTIGG